MDDKAQISKRAFEMWLYRRILKIPLTKIGRAKTLIRIIKWRITAYLGHILRDEKYTLLHTIMRGRVYSIRGIGREKEGLRNIGDWITMSVPELFHMAKDRETLNQWSPTYDRRGH